jgi:hypothetical protein
MLAARAELLRESQRESLQEPLSAELQERRRVELHLARKRCRPS